VPARTVSSGTLLELAPGQIDLWYTRTDQVGPELALRYRALLTPQELAQHSRFYFEKDRHRYLVTRALSRQVLSCYMPVELQAWRFEAGHYGKPHLVDPAGLAREVDFNISHTDGLVVFGIYCGKALGVDTESMQRVAPIEVAEHSFSAYESQRLRNLPPPEQAMRFWELWTLKESYIKARAMGLSLPLDQFSFDLDTPGSISISFADGFQDHPSRWQFWQLRPTEHHLLSVCAEAPGTNSSPIRLSIRETVPLLSHRLVRCPLARSGGALRTGN
jgi:4'-phosphopantetheinyl transferase